MPYFGAGSGGFGDGFGNLVDGPLLHHGHLKYQEKCSDPHRQNGERNAQNGSYPAVNLPQSPSYFAPVLPRFLVLIFHSTYKTPKLRQIGRFTPYINKNLGESG